MKRLLLATGLLVGTTGFSQAEWKHCGTHDALKMVDAEHPGYIDRVNEVFERAKYSGGGDRGTIYQIPVVVHILYQNDAENLHDSVIHNQIQVLNEDYRAMNADVVNLRDTFQTIVVDPEIEFILATFDPDGEITSGITRTETTVGSFLGVGGFPAEGIKSTTDGGIDPWDQSRYLNIWVGDISFLGSPSLLGYATPPDGLAHWPAGSTDGLSDGVVIHYEAFAANNPNPLDVGGGPIEVLGRTCTHEVGHYLGLRHIWGDGDCAEEDGVDDTPNAIDQSNQDCDTTKNTCVDAIGILGDLPDMVENFMDYSAETCQNSFTIGQVDIMRGVLENERLDLIEDNPAVSIDEFSWNFSVYPNPSGGDVTLINVPQGKKTVTVSNEMGQVIRQEDASDEQISIEGLSTGVYILRIDSENYTSTKKLVVTAE